MSTPIFKLDDINLNDLTDTMCAEEKLITNQKPHRIPRAIAIIGMDGRVGAAEDLESFWKLLISNREGIRALSEQRRRDLDAYLATVGVRLPLPESLYVKGTFLTDITGFDHDFFGISKQEAKCMDPNQRMFLETAWKALEDSGYGGKNIHRTDAGVFVGFTSDFGESYRHVLNYLDRDASEIAVAGNIKSIIASRLAYYLDLRGPAMLVDTACSSGLVAMHMACRAIRAGDCSMAIAGAVKCDIVPLAEDKESGVGIKDIQDTFAPDGHTRTFDDKCAGTSGAEGSFAFVLKPLEAAIRDRDTIRAVILGSAINQDGASNGITAPNSEAQEELIVRALNDAGVSAENISYIEAHGTATRLGDPIEISGIQRAFMRFTNRKQFCAIGSLKTNIGHLDNASGLGGVAKVVLAMQHKVIPASLNFNIPNRNIPFVQSPVYVNNQNASWPDQSDGVIRSGINSFGLSGTNCHMILESAPVQVERAPSKELGPMIMPLSAKNITALRLLAAGYSKCLSESGVDLSDAVMTASVGRLHHNFRLAIVFETRNQLCTALGRFADMGPEALPDPSQRYGEHRLIVSEKSRKSSKDITEVERERMNAEALVMVETINEKPTIEVLTSWADLYIQGAELPWNKLALCREARRIPLPTYPFQRTRCWPEPSIKKTGAEAGRLHPLLDAAAVRTIGHTLFKSTLCPSVNWELDEHRIYGTSLLPGTALVEMMVDCAWKLNGSSFPLVFKDIIFEQPFTVSDGSSKELHLLVENEAAGKHMRFASVSSDNLWKQHAEGLLRNQAGILLKKVTNVNLVAIGERLTRTVTMNSSDDLSRGLELGKRWNDSFVSGRIDQNAEEFLIEIALPEEYRAEQDIYHLHPALMDTAVNAANNMVGGDELYLPLSYGELVVHGNLPRHFFAHLRKKVNTKKSSVQRFDIKLYDLDGKPVVEVWNYCIKSAAGVFSAKKDDRDYGYRQTFRMHQLPTQKQLPSGKVLLAGKCPTTYKILSQALKDKGHTVVEIAPDSVGWESALETLDGETIALAVFAWDPPQLSHEHPELSEDEVNEAVYQGFNFIKAFSTIKLKSQSGVVALTRNTFSVAENDAQLHPGQAALGGLWRVGALEFETLNLRCIDHDGNTPSYILINEFADYNRSAFLAYRNGQVYESYIEPYVLPEQVTHEVIDDEGLFVLTGGTGDLGIEVAGLLARTGVRRLALLGFRSVPSRDSWENLLETSKDRELCRRLRQWLNLEQKLEVLEVRSVMIEEYRAVEKLICELRTLYGRIKGVIHMAGRAGDGFMLQKTDKNFLEVYTPKAAGAWNLHHATLEDRPEIFIEFSSISSLLLNPGQSDYTAANMFLDSLAEYRRQMGLPAISIQWPAWRETGIARRMKAVDESELFEPLNTDEALELFERILWKCKELPPVLMPGRARKDKDTDNVKQNTETGDGNILHNVKQVTLLGVDQPDEIELAVAGIWATTLGVDQLEADVEFSSMGGNSLLTSQMLREYGKLYPGAIELADLFTYTTVMTQAEYLKSQLGLSKSAENLKTAQNLNTGDNLKASENSKTADIKEDLDAILELVAKGEMTVEESSARISLNKRRDK